MCLVRLVQAHKRANVCISGIPAEVTCTSVQYYVREPPYTYKRHPPMGGRNVVILVTPLSLSVSPPWSVNTTPLPRLERKPYNHYSLTCRFLT